MKTFDFKQTTLEEILQAEVVAFSYGGSMVNYAVGTESIRIFLTKVHRIPFSYELLSMFEYQQRMTTHKP